MMLFLQNKKILVAYIFLLICLVPVFIGIFHPGFFLTDDGNWMIIRLSAFFEALRQGQFPVRFLPRLNNGYGYPVADFLYPLFLYSGSLIHILHINFVNTTKILFALSFILSAFGSFKWLKNKFGILAGFVGSLVFTLFPYHVWDMTKRGSLGEVLALGIIPFVFWQIDKGSVFLTALGIGLLITAHNTLALLFLPIIVGYFIVLKKQREGLFTLVLGFGLSAFFWLPALFDLQYTVFAKSTVSNFSQYFLSTQLYPLIGIVTLVIILLASSLRKAKQQFVYFFFITFLSIIFTTRISSVFWSPLHLESLVQFPFRFLSVTAIGVGFLAAFTIANWTKKYRYVVASLIIILLFISSWSYFIPKTYQYYPDTFYSTNQDTTTVQDEYMPSGVKQLPLVHPTKVFIAYGTIQNLKDKQSHIAFTVITSQPETIVIATVNFLGWKAFVDGKSVAVSAQKNTDFISFPVSTGQHTVEVKFEETPMRIFADFVSILCIVILIAGVVFSVIRLKRKAK